MIFIEKIVKTTRHVNKRNYLLNNVLLPNSLSSHNF